MVKSDIVPGNFIGSSSARNINMKKTTSSNGRSRWNLVRIRTKTIIAMLVRQSSRL